MTYHKFQKIAFFIRGMHCRSCELLLEEKFSHVKHVERSKIDYHRGLAEIYYSEHKPSMKELEDVVLESGYTVGEVKKLEFFSRNLHDYKELFWAIIAVFIAYVALRFIGISNLANLNFNTNQASYGMVILIGLVAGFSSCMALIGGLILGISAKHAEKHPEATAIQKFRPHLYFNLGRIGGYAVLGGLLGSVGSIVRLSTFLTSGMTLFAGAVMLIVGLQLIGIFPRLSFWKLTLPKSLSKFFGSNRHHAEYNYKNSMLVGALTFFLPCGFTQAMQVYAVSTGSFISGALIMGLFALGTAPGLFSIGGLTSALKGSAARKFFKMAGVVVIIFAFFNISNSLALAGINFKGSDKTSYANYKDPNVELVSGVQVVKMTESNSGYSPNKFTIQKGVPVKWIVNAKAPYSCAASLVVSKLGISKNLVPGDNVIEFTPKEVGNITFSCGMGMYTGVFTVVEKDSATPPTSTNSSSQVPTSKSACGGSGGGCGCGGGRKFDPSPAQTDGNAQNNEEVQQIKSTFTVNNDIQPNTFEVGVGKLVEYTIDVQENGAGCMYAITIPGLYENLTQLEAGKKIVMKFTPQKAGQYPITCPMGMVRGYINVK